MAITGFQYGRQARKFDPRIPHCSALMMANAPSSAIPAAKNWADGMPSDLGMLLNDQLGDCTCAGMLHAMQVWTYNASGTMRGMVDSEALWAYENFAGYNPQDPNTDQGGVEQTILTDWLKQGVLLADGSRDHLSAFFEVDPRNTADVRRTIFECGVAYIGFNVPQSLENDMGNGGVPQVWDVVAGQDQPVGGHCVILTGYDGQTFDLISWGSKYKMTESFFTTFTDETYAVIDADWIKSTGSTPLGMTLAQLDAQMSAIRAR